MMKKEKIIASLIIIAIATGLLAIGFLVFTPQENITKPVTEKPKINNSTYIEFQFLLLDKHIPSGYQTHMGNNNYGQQMALITSPNGDEMIGNIVFADNSTGKLLRIEGYSSVVKFTNSSDIWMSGSLSSDYIINDTETVDKNFNVFIEKEVTIKNSVDGTYSHWFKLDSKRLYHDYKSAEYGYPIVMFYMFYNNPTLDQHVRDCTNLYNDVVNHASDWDYAHAKFSVTCSQSDVFNGRWQ